MPTSTPAEVRPSTTKSVSIVGLASAACTITAATTLLGYLGQFWWAFDLLSHFRVQYVVAAAIAFLVALTSKAWSLACIAALTVTLNIATIAPLYTAPATPPASPERLRVMMLNTNISGGKPALVGAMIDETLPDVIVLAEVNSFWLTALQTSLARYPYRLSAPRHDPFGIALLSRRPLLQTDILRLGPAGFPTLVASIEWSAQPLTIVGTHPPPPFNRKMSAQRDAQLTALGRVLKAENKVLIVGDLNATPWSNAYRSLISSTGLQNCAQGMGVHPTWPTYFWPFGIPIDHCLVSPGVPVSRFWVGPDVGSDHFPIFVELGGE